MKKKTLGSPYSMMYLVTPAIYEKLLLCIDDGDKKLLDSLNKPVNVSQDKRPAQVIIDALASQEIGHSPIKMEEGDIEVVQTGGPVIQNNPIIPQNIEVTLPSNQPVSHDVPIVVPQPLQNQVPVSVTVLPQGDNPLPLPSTEPSGSNVIIKQQPITTTTQVLPIPTRVQSLPKPVTLHIPSDVVQPAAFSQPIKQPILIDDDPWGLMDFESKGIKRPKDETFEDSEQKKFNPTDIYHERDDQYRQGMLERIRNKRLHIDQQQNPLTRLPRDLVQWQPLQCVTNTTGGQICNPDPSNHPSIVKTEVSEPKLKVRKDIFIRPNTCKICHVRLGNAELLNMHMRLKHGNKKVKESFSMPALEDQSKRPRFQTPGTVSPVTPFVYDPNIDVPFRKKEKKQKKKRFTSPGNEPSAEALVYDPSKDVSFRKRKVKNIISKRKRASKHSSYRCPICEVSLGNLSLLKDHISLKHQMDPNEVIRDLATNVLSNPQPGSSRDFSDWSSIRIQPTRATARRQRFGQLKEKTKEFPQW